MIRKPILLVVLGGLVALGVGSYAIANSGKKNFDASLQGYFEVPALSTTGSGTFSARIDDDAQQLHYTLSYSGLEGTVRQAHIHFENPTNNGGISVWLCDSAENPAPSEDVPLCPASGSVSGTAGASDVVGPAGQGIAPGEFAEVVAAIRAGSTYANVHTTTRPGGEIRGQLTGDNRPGGA